MILRKKAGRNGERRSDEASGRVERWKQGGDGPAGSAGLRRDAPDGPELPAGRALGRHPAADRTGSRSVPSTGGSGAAGLAEPIPLLRRGFSSHAANPGGSRAKAQQRKTRRWYTESVTRG